MKRRNFSKISTFKSACSLFLKRCFQLKRIFKWHVFTAVERRKPINFFFFNFCMSLLRKNEIHTHINTQYMRCIQVGIIKISSRCAQYAVSIQKYEFSRMTSWQTKWIKTCIRQFFVNFANVARFCEWCLTYSTLKFQPLTSAVISSFISLTSYLINTVVSFENKNWLGRQYRAQIWRAVVS